MDLSSSVVPFRIKLYLINENTQKYTYVNIPQEIFEDKHPIATMYKKYLGTKYKDEYDDEIYAIIHAELVSQFSQEAELIEWRYKNYGKYKQ